MMLMRGKEDGFYCEMRKILSVFMLYTMRHKTALIKLITSIPFEMDFLSKNTFAHMVPVT